jgi:methionyl-tRNA formyltransferase
MHHDKLDRRHYILATTKPWNVTAFDRIRSDLPGSWAIVTTKQDLADMVALLKPRYVFFPHWSHIVPKAILETTECVCFHMADVPYGRGGSPLQNLIVRGHNDTVLSALHMTSELDAGPVYDKRPLGLEGTAAEIFNRSAGIAMQMIRTIVETEPVPVPQSGRPTFFVRRTPDQSVLPETGDLENLYDHIRMLDAPGYPVAYLEHGPFQIDFFAAQQHGNDGVEARVRITRRDTDTSDTKG